MDTNNDQQQQQSGGGYEAVSRYLNFVMISIACTTLGCSSGDKSNTSTKKVKKCAGKLAVGR
jgi:hypothetical protein